MDALSVIALGLAAQGGGGGGTTYTAGNGIDITNDEISVDKDVVVTFQEDWPTKSIDVKEDIEGGYKELALYTDSINVQEFTEDDNTIAQTWIDKKGLYIEEYPDPEDYEHYNSVYIDGSALTIDWTTADGEEGSVDITQLGQGGTEVSGTNDGTNWTSLTIDDDTYAIPSGGGSSEGAVRYDEAQTLSEAQFNQVMSNLQLGCSKNTYKDVVVNWTGSRKITSTNNNFSYAAPDIVQGAKYTLTMVYDGNVITTTQAMTYSGGPAFYNLGSLTNNEISEIVRNNSTTMNITARSPYSNKYVTSIKIESEEATTHYTKFNSNFYDSINGVKDTSSNGVVIGSTDNNSATSSGAVAIGRSTVTKGLSSKNMGSITMGYSSAAEGIVAGQTGAVAFGSSSYQNGINATSEGSIANGKSSSAYGIYAAASGSHAEGYVSGISGSFSNSAIKTSGTAAYARGYVTTSGGNVLANGICSTAIGTGVTATDDFSTAIGKWQDNTNTSFAFNIGNGTDNTHRSNALTVDWDGNLVCNNIPAPPSADGEYDLHCSIVDGVITYSWVARE